MSNKFDNKKLSLAKATPYLFIGPALLLMLVLVIYPLALGIATSFFNTDLAQKWDFIGIKNYSNLFTNKVFWKQLLLTVIFAALVVSAHFIIGTLLAIMLNRKIRFSNFYKVILILPWIFPDVVVALIFKWILNPMYGLLNYWLINWGWIDSPVSWLGSSSTAFITVVLVCIWKGYPLVMMNVLAGLQSIPTDLFDAAKVDGANKIQELFKITLPSIRPVIITAIILDTVWWFKHYTMIQLLTQGGPGSDTSIISLEIYKQAFSYYDFGKAAAMSVLVFIICVVISKAYRRIFDNEDY